MSGKAREISAASSTPLERAGDTQDRFVETLGDMVMRKMAGILEDDSADTMARVGAGKAILDWIRPKKNGPLIQVNNAPTLVSHLNLPAPQEREPVDSEVVEAEYQKVLPEPATPMEQAKLRLKLVEEAAVGERATPEALVPRSPTPRAPDRPAPASSVKPYR